MLASCMRTFVVAATFTSAALMSGCGGDPGPGMACPAIAAANFSVVVTDKATGRRICDATVEATDTASGDKAKLDVFGGSTDCAYSGGFYSRPGTFSLTVSKAGYTTQTQTGVKVEAGVCTVTPAQVSIAL